MRKTLDGILVLSVLLAPALPSFAQTFGQITGIVTDTTGGVLVGASVTVTNTQTGAMVTQQDQYSTRAIVSRHRFCTTCLSDQDASIYRMGRSTAFSGAGRSAASSGRRRDSHSPCRAASINPALRMATTVLTSWVE